jgi:WD40 repeat protein
MAHASTAVAAGARFDAPQWVDISHIFLLTFTPNGRTLISGSADGRIRVWDFPGGREVRQFPTHRGFYSFAVSPNGQTFAAGTHKAPYLWELATGKALPAPEGYPGITWAFVLAFSPDGKYLATGGDYFATIWEVSTNKMVGEYAKDLGLPTRGILFSPDSKALLTDHGCSINMWDIRTGKRLHSLPVSKPNWYIQSFTLSTDGKILVARTKQPREKGLEGDQALCVWDISIRKHLKWIPIGVGAEKSLALSPDGKTVAVGWEDLIQLWDLATGKVTHKLEGPFQGVLALAFSPDGKVLASGGCDGRIRLWDPKTGKEIESR